MNFHLANRYSSRSEINPSFYFISADGFYAIADLCSHDNGPVGEGELNDTEIKCPRHGARFDLTSGKALSMPAVVDIPAYPVRVVNEMIEVGVPNE